MATAIVISEAASRRRRLLPLLEKLPDLKGRWLTLYATIWVIMLSLALIGPVLAAHSVIRRAEHPVWWPYGFGVGIESGTLQIAGITSNEARRAGAIVGDRIVAIDGWTIPVSPAVNALARVHAAKAEGASTVFTLETGRGAPRDVRLTFRRQHLDDYYASAGVTFGFAIAVLIGGRLVLAAALLIPAVILFARERRKAVPAFLSLGFLLIAAANTTDGWDDLGVNSLIVFLIFMSGWMLALAALFAFPAGELTPRWTRFAVLAQPLLLVETLVMSSAVVPVTIGIFILAALAALVTRYRRLTSGDERQQLRWAFLGFIAGVVLIVTEIILSIAAEQLSSNDIRWIVWGEFFIILDAIGCLAIASGLLISLLRFRLYDADTIIGRSAAYGVLTIGFVALFAGTEKLAEVLGERYFEHSVGIAAGAVGAAVAAAVIVPLHNRVHRWAERRFQKPLIRLREGLPECLADLRDTASVARIAEAVMKRVAAGVRSTREALLLCEDDKLAIAGVNGVSTEAVEEWQKSWRARAGDEPLDCDRKDAAFPVRVRLCIDTGDEPETIGWLLLGPRPDGSFFGRDEREALAHVAGPVARAIHIAQLRETREANAESRLSTLEALINELAAAIGGGSAAANA